MKTYNVDFDVTLTLCVSAEDPMEANEKARIQLATTFINMEPVTCGFKAKGEPRETGRA